MHEPDYVRPLGSGAQPTDDDVSPHPAIIEDIEQQMREMQLARDAAAVSSRDYLIT